MSAAEKRSRARRRARHLVTFALGGALLFTLGRSMPAREDASPMLVHVDVPVGASPAQIDRAIEEAVLVEAALRLGLPWSDPFVRARLLADVRKSDPSAVAATDDELLRRARQLDLVRAHPVVRARVAEAMRRRLEHGIAVEPPTEAELGQYLRDHASRYVRPPRIDFRHVFVSAQRRGAALERAALDLAARLADEGEGAAEGLGDPTLLPRDQVAATPAVIDATLGPGVGEAIASAEPGRWSGPVRGTYGMHLVFVRDRHRGGLPPLSEIEDRVRADLIADRRAAQRERGVHALRAGVQVAVREVKGAS